MNVLAGERARGGNGGQRHTRARRKEHNTHEQLEDDCAGDPGWQSPGRTSGSWGGPELSSETTRSLLPQGTNRARILL